MLDEVHLKICHLLSIGMGVTDISKEVGVPRSTIYDWMKLPDMIATIDELGREFISQMRRQGQSYAPIAMQKLQYLVEHGSSDKAQFDAASKIVDKYLSNATKIEIDTTTDDDKLSDDILTKELNDIKSE